MDNILDQQYVRIRKRETSFSVSFRDLDPQKLYTHVAVCSINIPKTFYVLPDDAILQITEDMTTVDITFEKGNYNSDTFMTYFTSALGAGSGLSYVYSIAYQNIPDLGKYTYIVSGNATQPIFYTDNEYLADMMGINREAENVFELNQLISPNVIDFQAYDAILLKSTIVENKMNLLQEIYTSGSPYNSSIIWENPNIHLHEKKKKKDYSNVFNFSMLDADDNLLEFNGSYWSMVLCFFRADNLSGIIKDRIEYDIHKKNYDEIDD